MTRKTLLQILIDHFKYEHYLEIGVYKGKTFLPLKCKYKIAVDPAFRISPIFLLNYLFKNKTNFRNKYFQMTSDLFFKERVKRIGKQDLVFVDGLHTFEASLNDVLNSLKIIKAEGVIVLHDCYPPNKAAATPAKSHQAASKLNIPGWTGAWCGDIWKTIHYLREKYSDELDVFVINADHGLGIVRPKITGIKNLDLDFQLFEKIKSLTYEEMNSRADSMIGLTEEDFLNHFISHHWIS